MLIHFPYSINKSSHSGEFLIRSSSLGAQVATAGIQMARSLTGKKIRLVRVTVKKGYRVFLKDMSALP